MKKDGSWQGLKSICNLYNIRRRLSKKNPVWIVAAICTAAFLGVMYSFAPAYVCSSYLISAVFMYFLGAYISLALNDKENDVFEEVMLLHSENLPAYYISREFLQLGIGFIFAFVLAVAPVLRAVSWPGFFTRAMTAADVIWGGATILFCGLCGIETADCVHPRIIGRKYGICLVVLVSVLAVCKHSLIQTLAVFKVLNILMPPVMDSFLLLGNSDRFEPAGNALILLHMLLYSLAVVIIKIRLMTLKKYRR